MDHPQNSVEECRAAGHEALAGECWILVAINVQKVNDELVWNQERDGVKIITVGPIPLVNSGLEAASSALHGVAEDTKHTRPLVPVPGHFTRN